MATRPGRWDRSVLKHVCKVQGQRREIERRLALGESGLSIANRLGLPKSTWVSACKKNPLPGGPLDPKGKIAAYSGDWVDEGGLTRPWKGFNDKGKPRLFVPISKKKEKGGSAHGELGILAASFGGKKRSESNSSTVTSGAGRKHASSKTADVSGVVPFTKAKKDSGLVTSSARSQSHSALDSDKSALLPSNARPLPPNAKHAESEDGSTEDLGDPIVDEVIPGKRGKGVSLARIQRLVKEALPIAERIRLLAEIAGNTDEPQTAIRAIQMMNELDGTAKKTDEGQSRGNAPLFALPKDTKLNFAPVGQATETQTDRDGEAYVEEDLPADEQEETEVNDDPPEDDPPLDDVEPTADEESDPGSESDA